MESWAIVLFVFNILLLTVTIRQGKKLDLLQSDYVKKWDDQLKINELSLENMNNITRLLKRRGE